MDLFQDVSSPCERCGGTGCRDEVTSILIGGQSVHDILQVPLDEISGFFEGHLPEKQKQSVKYMLELTGKTGLGHLAAGRLLKTLSTGELQRLKLVSGLAGESTGNTLFLLDEPTGGLDHKDTRRLLDLFNELIEAGNTIVCVTHEPLLMASASRTIELGPGGGSLGGRVIAQAEGY
jgi:excinuclease ABC subunit A